MRCAMGAPRGSTAAGLRPRAGCEEDALTYSPDGLGLAPGLVVDTHFFERARGLRLLQLLADSGAPRGLGIDETSAVYLRWHGEAPLLRALGRSGAWLVDATPEMRGHDARRAHALPRAGCDLALGRGRRSRGGRCADGAGGGAVACERA